MTPSDFGLRVLASLLANKLSSISNTNTQPVEIEENSKTVTNKQALFTVYDVYHDLEEMLEYVTTPVAHIIVENSPSSAYNLTTLVIEDKNTGIWFVFSRGRMAFQGTGGGSKQTDRAVNIFRTRNIQ